MPPSLTVRAFGVVVGPLWYQSIILAQPVVYDIRKEIIQSNSSCNSRNAVGKRAKIKKVKFWNLELRKTFSGFFWVLDQDHFPKFLEFSE